MPTVLLMEFDHDKRQFKAFKEMELASVPTSGDKIITDIDGIGYIFLVHDVHYGDNNAVDVNIIRISNITDYYSSKYAEII